MSCHVTIVESSKPGLILLTEVISKAQTLPIGLLRISIPVYHLLQILTLGFVTWERVLVAQEEL